ncbi:MAG TPA: metalloregulator ArsR/SmtB family transcription factor [Mycobacteriales bacterium]|nr:metalloregulator ArsR/SmtB family transcription factor [Mycobacteriales bacterium]
MAAARTARSTGAASTPRSTAPLYLAKAELFRTLGHPARIRVLELLSDGEMSVAQLQHEIGVESSHLSHQLGVLRRAGLVTTRKQATNVYYSLAAFEVRDLLAVARQILTEVLTDQLGLLDALQQPETSRRS